MRTFAIALVALASVSLGLHLALAGVDKPDAVIKLKGGSVAAGVGISWGSGTLVYRGKRYPISIEGLNVGDVGVTKVTASGKVYGLKKLEDLDGNYAAVDAGASLGGCGETAAMKNQNGVTVNLVSTTQGVKLALAAGGVSIKVVR